MANVNSGNQENITFLIMFGGPWLHNQWRLIHLFMPGANYDEDI